jgi:prephenate dehydratase
MTTPDPTPHSAPRVGFQGELGAYSDEALRLFFGAAARPVPCRDFVLVGERVSAGEVDYGMLPIENSVAGGVVPSYDVLASTGLVILGEIVCPIHHCVLALPGAETGRLTRILSHPVALAQCRRWLSAHPEVEAVTWYDTAGAARTIAAEGDPAAGAIASGLAAERYGLVVLDRNVEDRPDNQTRFVAVARPGAPLPARPTAPPAGMRTSLLAETGNVPGALLALLRPFAERGVNLCKLESRPADEPWSYRFFVELEGADDDPPVRDALAEARESAAMVRVLGSYPRWYA